jgi:hypothetical protein
MKCKDIKYLLPELVSNKLSQEETLRVNVHLRFCRSCSLEHFEIVSIFNLLESESVYSPPATYWNSLLPHIHTRTNKESAFGKVWIQIGLPVAASVLALFFLVKVFDAGYQPKFSDNRNELNNIITDLVQQDASNLSSEEIKMIASVGLKDENSSDKYIIKKILNEEQNVVESDYVNVETAVKNMDDSDFNKLISYLDQGKN